MKGQARALWAEKNRRTQASHGNGTEGRTMDDQPTEWQLNTLADELAKASLEATKLGETQIERDYYLAESWGPDGQLNILAQPAPPTSNRRVADHRPSMHVTMNIAPAPIPAGVRRILDMKDRIEQQLGPAVKQPPPAD